jgi:hypothetical protein
MNVIESLDQWKAFSAKLSSERYRLWQTQFDTRSPEGFHAWFSASRQADIEVVTHNDDVHDAIVKYRPK